MAHGKFVTAINCMDGRVQAPVSAWMMQTFGADYVDTITEPGPDGILTGGSPELIESIRRRVGISISAHGSRVVAIVAHDDCAGNPVTRQQHMNHLAKSVELLAIWNPQVRVVSLWVNEQWAVELVSDTGV